MFNDVLVGEVILIGLIKVSSKFSSMNIPCFKLTYNSSLVRIGLLLSLETF